MPRKPRNEGHTVPSNFNPPWMKRSKDQSTLFQIDVEDIAKRILPIFGGTGPTGGASQENNQGNENNNSGSGSENSGTTTSGGDQKQGLTAEEAADLLEQVKTLTTSGENLQKELQGYKDKEDKAKRESMGREEALNADLEAAQETIVKMDNALKHQAIINAINSFKDIEFHDPNFAAGKLGAEILEGMEVDLDAGTVTVKGVENDLRRIAKEYDWAVKKRSANNDQNNGSGNQNGATRNSQNGSPIRNSGAPPANPGSAGDKATRRKALAERFPVIAHGRKL
jgi:hypothetical protein